MAPNVQVKLNSRAVDALLKSPEMQADLAARAARVAAAAGEGMESDVSVGRTRARGYAWTATAEARRAEATDRRLTAALDAAR